MLNEQMATDRLTRRPKKAAATALLLGVFLVLVLTTGHALVPEALPFSVLDFLGDRL
jgi:hypothetical protein